MRAYWMMIGVGIGLAGCGGGGDTLSLRGDFPPGGEPPTEVLAVEAGRRAAVREGAFELADLTAGPNTLRLLRGQDTLATVSLPDAPGGAELVLHGLRIDEATGRAFPASVEGAEVVVVNGIRIGGAALPREADLQGRVLAVSDQFDALLLRPDDDDMPDVRVILGPATEVVTPDGDPVEPSVLSAGDSLRVQGGGDQGYLVATRLTVPRALAAGIGMADTGDVGSTGGSEDGATEGDGGGDGEGGATTAPRASPPAVVSAPAVPRVVREVARGRGRVDRPERGGGRGNARGGGNGKGKGKG